MNWIFVLTFLIYFRDTEAYSQGAPNAACGNLVPRHGPAAQTLNAPFKITPLQNSVEAGGQLVVRLTADSGSSFKGFLLQAHNASSASSPPQALGKFIVNANAKLVSCSGTDNSITHSSPAAKQQIDVTWQAPSDYAGDVIFRATFVKDYGTFWVQVPSSVRVLVRGGSSVSTTQRPVTTTRPSTTPILSVYDGCGRTKNCFGSPLNCESTKNCEYLVSYVGKGTVFEFELFGTLSSSSGDSYLAVGFSKDARMGSDSVNECVYINGRVGVHTSYNLEGKQNIRTDEPNLISVLDTRYVDGYLYCKFTRQPRLTTNAVTFDLNEPHYLLLAKGPAQSDAIEYHESRTATPRAVSLGPVTTTSPATTVSPLPTGEPLSPSVYEGCGKIKSCFGMPSNCPSSKSCNSLVTYARNNSQFVFELYGKPVGAEGTYVAVGFSKDSKMGEDSVNECVLSGNRVNVYTSQNYNRQGKYNQRINASIVNVLDARYENGYLYCKFTRQAVFNYENVTYNLMEPQYLLIARGPATSSAVGYHSERDSTSAAVDIGQVGDVQGNGGALIKVHGVLMILAWILAASCGILVARYFRQTWVGKQVGGKDLWFVIHRILMSIVWLLTIIGFIIIFVSVDGWSQTAAYNPHAVIGCITTGLAFIQPIMAYFRPHPGTSRRPIFNWAHWTVGNSAHILGIACVFLAVDLSPAGLPRWMTWVLVAYVVFHAIVHLVLTVLHHQHSKQSRSSSTVFAMKDISTNGNGHTDAPANDKRDAPGSKMRKILLAVYLIAIAGLVAALIAAVVKAPW